MELQNAERTLFARVRSGSSAEASSVEEEVPEGRTLPLTSSRVTMTYLRRVARALALPTKGTKTELLTTIEGKIGQEHQVQNVQIIIQERELGERLFLVDDQGVFLEEEAECKEPAQTVTSELVETDNSVESLKQKK